MEKEKQIFDKRNFYTDDDSGKVFIISLLAPILITLLFTLLYSGIAAAIGYDAEEATRSVWYNVLASVVSSLTLLGIYLIYNKMYKIDNRTVNFDFKMGWKNYLLAIAIGIIALFALQPLISMFDRLWITLGYTINDLSITNFGMFVLFIFVSAVTPAICEEIIFRGMILSGLRTKFNDIVSISLSAVMFALMHNSLQQFIYPFLLGLILGWLYLRTGSIIASILAHFANNFFVLLISYLQTTTGFSMLLPIEWWSVLLAIILAAVVFVIVFLFDRFVFKHQSKSKVERTPGRISLFLWVSIALAGLIFLFNLVAAFV